MSGITEREDFWGDNSAVALHNECKYLELKGVSITYKEYENIGHDFTNEMFIDMIDFFNIYDEPQ